MVVSPTCRRTTYGLMGGRMENVYAVQPETADQDWYKFKDDKFAAIPCSSFSLYQTQFKVNMATSLPEFSLQGKIAVITGGARGIGLEMSKALAEAGADVAMMYVSNDATHDTAAEIGKKFNKTVKAYKCELTNVDQVREVIDKIHSDFGRIDIFVANAGVSEGGAAEDLDINVWHRVMDVNVNGCFYTIQAVARHMLKQPNGGSIITLSSISASIVNRPQFQVVYNTSKAAVGMMTKCLAAEWATRKIRVNAISPGYMMTDMVTKYIANNKELGDQWVEHTPMKRIGDPKELRGAVVFLASDAASYMTGSEIVVDGGYLVY
ncbi:hypothetical protein INT43_007474 [Umbelopsis isabellina]|uniref:Uncharacterized protein n=1 Tax=Mortierella isabellina TaxID=91625 RepID=A0A8H7UJZ0_MORIS|nr:hypothetical protein INT43_007474 [Umbelopsis isabellina]